VVASVILSKWGEKRKKRDFFYSPLARIRKRKGEKKPKTGIFGKKKGERKKGGQAMVRGCSTGEKGRERREKAQAPENIDPSGAPCGNGKKKKGRGGKVSFIL